MGNWPLTTFVFTQDIFSVKNRHKTIKNKVKVPMNKKTRSLNVAMSVAIISAEALRQNNLLK